MENDVTGQLPLEDYGRYGRQMIMEGFGLPGQLKLQRASVVVIGAGGLGCPALQYLAAAGVGRIGIVDADTVELSNLQRQILHSEQTVGMLKSESAAQAIRRLNSRVKVDAISQALSPSNATSILRDYDIILDCCDNAATRYLISDTAIHLGKPLVSGAAEKLQGQLCIFNLAKDGPCRRCLFPAPPSPESGSCEVSGILGAVTGTIGNLQALETINIITGLSAPEPSLLLFSAFGSPRFQTITFDKDPECVACSEAARKSAKNKEIDYVQFCGGEVPNWERRGLADGDRQLRITVKDFRRIIDEREKVNIIDVRPPVEFGICSLPKSYNVPLNELIANPAKYMPGGLITHVYIVCRLGNDSQVAAKALKAHADATKSKDFVVKDVVGGLRAWTRQVDANFPMY